MEQSKADLLEKRLSQQEALLEPSPSPADEDDETAELLAVADKLRALPDPEINQDKMFAVLAKAAIENQTETTVYRRFPVIFRIAASVLVLFCLLSGVSYASMNALPGDFLYSWKLGTEKVRFMITQSPSGKSELHIRISDERLSELQKQLQRGNKIDATALASMLDNAKLALMNLPELSAEQKGQILRSVRFLNREQYEVLKQAYQQASVAEKKAMAPYLCMCHTRMSTISSIETGTGCRMDSRKGYHQDADADDDCEYHQYCGCKPGKPCIHSQKDKSELLNYCGMRAGSHQTMCR